VDSHLEIVVEYPVEQTAGEPPIKQHAVAQLDFQLLHPSEKVTMGEGVANVETAHSSIECIFTLDLVAHIRPRHQLIVHMKSIRVYFFVVYFHISETVQLIEAIIGQ